MPIRINKLPGFLKSQRTAFASCLFGVALLFAASSKAQTVTEIAAGGYHSLILKSDGSLWGMGNRWEGQLGDGTFDWGLSQPTLIEASNVISVAAGRNHSLFLKADGSLWAMGENLNGQLGDGTYVRTNKPELIVSNSVIAVDGGRVYSIFLKSDGSLWAMGDNRGLATSQPFVLTNRPLLIVSNGVTKIAAGRDHALFLKTDSSLWAMGDNSTGQLGNGNVDNVGVPVPEQIVAADVTAIAAGDYHSLFAKTDGSLWGMGNNWYGQLGDSTTVGTYIETTVPKQIVASNVTAIAAGVFHSLFLKSDGSLWAMGYNQFGQLGNGTYTRVVPPQQIVPSNVTSIAAGELHSLFLTSDGGLWAMGGNAFGALGNGTYSMTNSPQQIETLPAPPYFRRIHIQLLDAGKVSLSCRVVPNSNYVLDHSVNLFPAMWVPQATNQTDASGLLVFTNTPNSATNNFWRIRWM